MATDQALIKKNFKLNEAEKVIIHMMCTANFIVATDK